MGQSEGMHSPWHSETGGFLGILVQIDVVKGKHWGKKCPWDGDLHRVTLARNLCHKGEQRACSNLSLLLGFSGIRAAAGHPQGRKPVTGA